MRVGSGVFPRRATWVLGRADQDAVAVPAVAPQLRYISDLDLAHDLELRVPIGRDHAVAGLSRTRAAGQVPRPEGERPARDAGKHDDVLAKARRAKTRDRPRIGGGPRRDRRSAENRQPPRSAQEDLGDGGLRVDPGPVAEEQGCRQEEHGRDTAQARPRGRTGKRRELPGHDVPPDPKRRRITASPARAPARSMKSLAGVAVCGICPKTWP